MTIGVVLACGPSADEATDEESTGTSSGSSTDSTTGLSQTIGDPESTGAHESSTTSMTSSESSSGTTSDCGCVMFQIAQDEPCPEGFSFIELVESLPGADGPWTWTAIEGMPSTTVHVAFELASGAGSWRDDPCSTDDSCRGLSGPVTVHISTEDGLLDETFEGGIDGILGETAALDVTAGDLRGFGGTLSDAAFVDDNGDPIVVDSAGVGGRWTWEDRTPSGRFFVYTPVPQAEAIVLGESVE
jgi:hypothetical protein